MLLCFPQSGHCHSDILSESLKNIQNISIYTSVTKIRFSLVKPLNSLKTSQDPSNSLKLLGLEGCEHEAEVFLSGSDRFNHGAPLDYPAMLPPEAIVAQSPSSCYMISLRITPPELSYVAMAVAGGSTDYLDIISRP